LRDYQNKVHKSVNAMAQVHSVTEATLRNYIKGGKSRVETKETQHLLSVWKEKALEQWILDVSKNGYPSHKSQV
jgi:hypothetical protein